MQEAVQEASDEVFEVGIPAMSVRE